MLIKFSINLMELKSLIICSLDYWICFNNEGFVVVCDLSINYGFTMAHPLISIISRFVFTNHQKSVAYNLNKHHFHLIHCLRF